MMFPHGRGNQSIVLFDVPRFSAYLQRNIGKQVLGSATEQIAEPKAYPDQTAWRAALQLRVAVQRIDLTTGMTILPPKKTE